MDERKQYHDQARRLRQKMKDHQDDEQQEEKKEVHSLPPRSSVHQRNDRKKKTKWRLRFPLIRFLLLLFFLIIIAAITSPMWLNN
ncbi:hypothetical protein [Bacillus suaedae]|uniref:TMEM62 C-terminal domain-containing protein n=1 Tax=Halalkalibacter suaedae TaxID=2822140 RepID=A0A940WY23_9BACI|nr:hypothetical protein [Bacillus suaedae]MBP3950550.1 hypothetical protein [Bacillus suaedae]